MATTYKILGQLAPADTAIATLYTVPAATQTIVSTIHVANVTASSATMQIYINTATFAYDVSIAANSVVSFTEGITLGETDYIEVQSSVADALSFHAFGSEIA